jgi:hypothetical protein
MLLDCATLGFAALLLLSLLLLSLLLLSTLSLVELSVLLLLDAMGGVVSTTHDTLLELIELGNCGFSPDAGRDRGESGEYFDSSQKTVCARGGGSGRTVDGADPGWRLSGVCGRGACNAESPVDIRRLFRGDDCLEPYELARCV